MFQSVNSWGIAPDGGGVRQALRAGFRGLRPTRGGAAGRPGPLARPGSRRGFRPQGGGLAFAGFPTAPALVTFCNRWQVFAGWRLTGAAQARMLTATVNETPRCRPCGFGRPAGARVTQLWLAPAAACRLRLPPRDSPWDPRRRAPSGRSRWGAVGSLRAGKKGCTHGKPGSAVLPALHRRQVG